ncbi:OprO/OprP family phosphate-selective porin [Tautonia plasticadhaerens]|uniref:Phosphate-selective porin O and P n=1 Tax=Tautonia plasticadhaerens TaxID=2527974 RepID=A0A518GXH2_9BACT|nr:porin [Tautonia plasticadhaerens]QDV33287.1 Phosphate-selective porin O and P [Tautonia plasticadhaerens]
MPSRSATMVLALIALGTIRCPSSRAQGPDSAPPTPSAIVPPPPADGAGPPPAIPDDGTVPAEEALLRRLEQLEREVGEVRQLRQRVSELETELDSIRLGPGSLQGETAGRSLGSLYEGDRSGGSSSSPSSSGSGDGGSAGGDSPTAGYSNSGGEGTFSAGGGGGAGPNSGGTSGTGAGQGSVGRGQRVGQRQPLGERITAEYKYNFAGGFFKFSDEDGEFVLNVQNIVTADGTFYDVQNAPTEQKNFTIPFQRLYLYGNVTKNWEFQVSEQSSLGGFNLLDAIVNVHYDDRFMLKFGRFLAPFYYQDYATFPMLVPAVTYSPLVQFSAQRETGLMAWGKLSENRIQYQAGVFTGVPDSYFDLDDNLDFVGSLTLTPFKPSGISWLQDLGFGVSTQVGWQNYMLNEVDVPTFIAGAGTPNLNQRFVTASGVPFFIYEDDVRALGERVRVAPHFFRYGRLSVLGEYVYQSRELASPLARGTSIQHGFYVTGSYFLTGEEYTGDGTGGFPTIIPNRPFNPSEGEYGPGAWEVAFQFTHLNIGNEDVRRGFARPIWATRLDETMAGINWWPNKYVRVSFDWVNDEFNKAIPWPVSSDMQTDGVRTNPISHFNTFWTRVAIFF